MTLNVMMKLHEDDKELAAYKKALLGDNLVLSNKYTSILYL